MHYRNYLNINQDISFQKAISFRDSFKNYPWKEKKSVFFHYSIQNVEFTIVYEWKCMNEREKMV